MSTCSSCSKQAYNLLAKGLCAACYQRLRKRGTTAYADVRARSPCSVEGCYNLSVAQGYCEVHYRRWKRHGVVEHERFDRWGHVSKHPLSHSYYWARQQDGVNFHKDWNDFWQFERDVVARPSPRHKLAKLDKAKPLAPDNFYWKPPKFDIGYTEDPKAYMRAIHASNPRQRKAAVLKKTYGITIDQYEAMAKSQGGLCGLCAKPEVTPNKATGLPRDLSVDHCHGHGHVRGLLCSRCNAGLGNFNDEPELLRKAIAYLEKNALPKPDD